MALPQTKTSKRKRNMRRSHQALRSPNLVQCSNCGALNRSHRVCPQCGYYKGKEVIQVEAY